MTNGNDPCYPYAWKTGTDANGKDVCLVLNDNPTQLTKREMFAAMALQGLCNEGAWSSRIQKQAENINSNSSEAIAVYAVDLADALITALNDGV